MSLQPDRATLARDELLDILSDARTVAPVIQTGLYHSALHIQSYFYVFSHKTHSKEYIVSIFLTKWKAIVFGPSPQIETYWLRFPGGR